MIRVLIADDSVTARELLAAMLSANPGIEVIGMAKDGREAVELTKCLRPDLVTMDLHMPVMNGFEFLDRYAEEFEVHAPVVAMLTSSHLGKDRERAMQYSFVKSYFEKPLQADHLRVMAELLRE